MPTCSSLSKGKSVAILQNKFKNATPSERNSYISLLKSILKKIKRFFLRFPYVFYFWKNIVSLVETCKEFIFTSNKLKGHFWMSNFLYWIIKSFRINFGYVQDPLKKLKRYENSSMRRILPPCWRMFTVFMEDIYSVI